MPMLSADATSDTESGWTSFDKHDEMSALADFSKSRVLVVGDLILDRYIQGKTSRISREAPVAVVLTEAIDERPGGAANTAANTAALGAHTTLIGFIGQDAAGESLCKLLTENTIRAELVESASAETIVKSRILSKNQQLLRLDRERGYHDKKELTKLYARYMTCLDDADVVVLSDYASGTMRDAQKLIAAARKANKPVFVDPRQRNFYSYKGATVLTPNYDEFRAIVGSCDDLQTLERLGLELKEDLSLTALLVTRGKEGMSLIQDAKHIFHLHAKAQEVYDVTGAGDTVIAVMATAYACGLSLPEAMRLANQAASLVVAKSGTATTSSSELEYSLRREADTKIVRELPTLLEQLEEARHRGLRIVMTNGCFDILHAGHIHSLRQAASLGDCLIVAVNDDNSVRQIKGEERPFNNLAHRLSVLAELHMIDWLIPFSETTPLALVEAITPDVLAKGGDYKMEQVDGYQHVIANGGQVVILDYVEGLSSTKFLEKLT